MKKDGGSAFPGWSIGWIEHDGIGHPVGPNIPLVGMSLRDYFAGQAITLFPLSEQELDDLVAGDAPDHGMVARFCYGLADAMLAHRDKEEA